MRLTLAYRQKLHDPKESTDILSIFSRFLDIPGLVYVRLQFFKPENIQISNQMLLLFCSNTDLLGKPSLYEIHTVVPILIIFGRLIKILHFFLVMQFLQNSYGCNSDLFIVPYCFM